MLNDQLGWSLEWAGRLDAFRMENPALADAPPARVTRQDRGGYIVLADGRPRPAVVAGALRNRALRGEDLPGVGDWVLLRPTTVDGPAVIEAVLPRRTLLTRMAAGGTGRRQVVAANLDRLLICCGLDHDFNPRRVERYVTLAHGHAIEPFVILTKADLCPYADARRQEIEAVAPGATVLTVDTRAPADIERVRALVPTGWSAALTGSSGVGKSSLINGLLGTHELRIGDVREHDSRGKHTTTFRQLFVVPGAGVVIDTPGMRELGLAGDEGGVDATFVDIAALADQCRFRDCTHEHEPGCRVRDAVRRGELAADRLESLHKQRRELAFEHRKDDPAAHAAERAKWKVIHKAARKHMRDKYGE